MYNKLILFVYIVYICCQLSAFPSNSMRKAKNWRALSLEHFFQTLFQLFRTFNNGWMPIVCKRRRVSKRIAKKCKWKTYTCEKAWKSRKSIQKQKTDNFINLVILLCPFNVFTMFRQCYTLNFFFKYLFFAGQKQKVNTICRYWLELIKQFK